MIRPSSWAAAPLGAGLAHTSGTSRGSSETPNYGGTGTRNLQAGISFTHGDQSGSGFLFLFFNKFRGPLRPPYSASCILKSGMSPATQTRAMGSRPGNTLSPVIPTNFETHPKYEANPFSYPSRHKGPLAS